MEHILRCNTLMCRTSLNDHAVVTTCSHIFCIDCANRLQLSSPPAGQRPVCPACDAHLTNPDDAVITNLNPTEDYKTSVLSGLSPNVIMECAGRALSFWAYQVTQEVVYQEFLAKSLTEKYASINSQMDKIIHQANTEMSDLRVKMDNMLIDQDNLRHKNDELVQAFRDKSRKQSQTQELYDKLKRRVMLGQVQDAASDVADQTIHASAGDRFMDPINGFDQVSQHSSVFAVPRENMMGKSRFTNDGNKPPSMPPLVARRSANQVLNGPSSQEHNQSAEASQTPSSHRQRLANGGTIGMGLARLQNGHTSGIPLATMREVVSRQPLTSLSPNRSSNYAGYGLRAGAKISHPVASAQGIIGGNRPMVKSRVAQRPVSSAFIGDRISSFGFPSGGSGTRQSNEHNQF